MNKLIRLGLAGCLAGLLSATVVHRSAASGPPATCTATLTIFTTSTGTVTTSGQVTHYRDSGVGGFYSSGPLAGYSISGAQNIMVNNVTHQSELQGSFTASGPGGSVVISYTGHANLTTGMATGHFETLSGTGGFATFHWEGSIDAHLVSLTPPTFLATDSGFCQSAP
jgi:hypothetical protein